MEYDLDSISMGRCLRLNIVGGCMGAEMPPSGK